MATTKRQLDGVALRRARIASGLTTAELAHKLHVSVEAVYHWETGITQPSAKNLPKVAAAVNSSIADLCGNPDRATTLADLRLAAGLTQIDLAEKLGTNKSMISVWERGKSAVPNEKVVQYATALGVSVGDVFDAIAAVVPAEFVGFTNDEVRIGELLVGGNRYFYAASPDSRYEVQVDYWGGMTNLKLGADAVDAPTVSRHMTVLALRAQEEAAHARLEELRELLGDEPAEGGLSRKWPTRGEMARARLQARKRPEPE
ncbi:transcriptional regulator, XRE family [Segniliparus rotundus DSM 44985]|uniref:Transcriptional regulator, XRE family n=1 Tax=Segniliparus rotundus (strain ATCC BAA-972 / CDC 1076 / CIP 108378 / DSM 44985 / JCM 13578) TaxID=640132 RepID=D6Z8B8_SEGRD|nr:helix-turn-helix transcriptional regulator [Segniliparus rotundus]ADG98198.1 transcriptional regulator, XRE family [Segniliparus rotundus DSM 44985]